MSTPSWKPIPISDTAKRTSNPIRKIVDNLKSTEPNPSKEFISLSLGDPTIFGNFKAPDSCVEEVIKQLRSHKANGYPPAHGYESAREAIARKFTTPNRPALTASDVIIASGCSGAVELCISVLANPGQNILIPRPGFSLYQTICESKGIGFRHYNLNPERNWEVDLEHLESLVDENTACILINNPSNPCGSVYSKDHLLEILAVAEKLKLPIIADEIYAEMAFRPFQFIPLASLSNTVPILSVCGLAKRYLVPGWRVGWIVIHDANNLFQDVRKGLVALAGLILGANSLIQSAIPELLFNTPESFYAETLNALEENAKVSLEMVSKIPGLKAIVPQGAMYTMIGIKTEMFRDIKSDIEFTQKLLAEESVLCLPGQCFQFPNYFRVVITAPKEKLQEAFERITQFCHRHSI